MKTLACSIILRQCGDKELKEYSQSHASETNKLWKGKYCLGRYGYVEYSLFLILTLMLVISTYHLNCARAIQSMSYRVRQAKRKRKNKPGQYRFLCKGCRHQTGGIIAVSSMMASTHGFADMVALGPGQHTEFQINRLQRKYGALRLMVPEGERVCVVA